MQTDRVGGSIQILIVLITVLVQHDDTSTTGRFWMAFFLWQKQASTETGGVQSERYFTAVNEKELFSSEQTAKEMKWRQNQTTAQRSLRL